jgi:AcrR family transcriptional regulator
VSKKKEEILNVALKLFNERGIDEVKTRDIAKTLGISLGNLTYHFPTKSDIVYALFLDWGNKVEEALSKNSGNPEASTLINYYYSVKIIFTVQLEYKFLVHKRYGEIATAFPVAHQFARDFLKIRFDSWEQLNVQLVSEKLAKKELIEESHAHSHVINMLALYWHQEFLIYYPELTDQQKIQKALNIFFQSYKPYLTKEGLDELEPLLSKLEHY